MAVFRIEIDEDEDFKLVCEDLKDAGFSVLERFAVFGIAVVEAPTAQALFNVGGIIEVTPTIYASGL